MAPRLLCSPAMLWTPLRFILVIALMALPFLTPCARPAQSTAEDRAAIAKLAEHLRRLEKFADHHTAGKWLVHSSGAAAAGRNYAHAPILQIGGVYERTDQARIVAEIKRWRDTSRFDTVKVYFYGEPESADNPSSALLNLQQTYTVILDGAPAAR